MSPKTKPQVGERLPYLLAKLKTPRILERLEQTATTAREEGWPYEQFLEVLLEAEVFARDASGSRNRIRRAAFPAHKTLEDFDFTAQPAAEKPLIFHLAQLAWTQEHKNVCFFGPPGTGKSTRDRAAPAGLAGIIDDDFYVVARNYTFDLDTTAWGWIHLLIGILLVVTGWGLFSGHTWARATGIVLAIVSAIENFFFIPYYPFWSILLIALDVWVIWALTRSDMADA